MIRRWLRQTLSNITPLRTMDLPQSWRCFVFKHANELITWQSVVLPREALSFQLVELASSIEQGPGQILPVLVLSQNKKQLCFSYSFYCGITFSFPPCSHFPNTLPFPSEAITWKCRRTARLYNFTNVQISIVNYSSPVTWTQPLFGSFPASRGRARTCSECAL